MKHALFGLAWVVVSIPCRAAFGQFEPPTALVGGHVVMADGSAVEDATIVIRDGRIEAVGKDAAVPSDAERIDLGGMVVYPGFIDGCTNAGMTREEPSDEERRRVEDEEPDVREGPQSETVRAYRRLMHPDWRAEQLYDPSAAKTEKFRRNGFTTALVAPKFAIFSGSSAVVELGDAPLRRSILAVDVAQHAAFVTGVDRGDRQARRRREQDQMPPYPMTTAGAMAAFRQIMLDAGWYRSLGAWGKRHPEGERPPVDRDLEALLKCLDKKKPVVFLANTENEIYRALDAAAEFGVRPIIAGAREGWKTVERLKRDEAGVIVSLKWSSEPEYKETPDWEREPPATMPAELEPVFDEKWERQPFEPERLFNERRRLWEEEVDNALRLHEAGIAFAFGTFEMKSLEDFSKNLHKAIERGLPEAAAVAALSKNAAALFGVASQVGSVEAGKLANLAVYDRTLSEEKARAVMTFVEGKRFDVGLLPKKRDREERRRRGLAARGEEESGTGAETQPAEAPAASQPTSQKAAFPEFDCETKADRKPAAQTGGHLLIQNATLLTITDGDLEKTDLLVQDGRIKQIGQGIAAPPGVMSVDLSGYYVMPGIIDCHSHICSDGGLNEASRSVTPEVRIADVVDHNEVAAYRALAGGATMVHTMHGSANTIGGQNVVLELRYGWPADQWRFAAAPRTVKFALGENVKQSNWGPRGTRFPNTRMGVETTIRRSFDAALRDRAKRKKFDEEKAAGGDPRPVRPDLRLEALNSILDGDIFIHSHCYRADEILRLLQAAEDYGVRVAVLQHVLEGYRVIPEMGRHGCGASTFSDWWGYKIEAYNATPYNAARMMQGGVVTTVNSDSAEVGRHLNWEAAKSMRFGGLSPNDCLKMITINGALQLGVADQVGSIEVGKRANLAVFNGHPLGSFSKCMLTLIEGEIFFQHRQMKLEAPPAAIGGRTFAKPAEPLKIAESKTGEYWIVGATVHPISHAEVEGATVVIKDGRIDRVVILNVETPPEGVTAIDARGLHVYPGMVDAASGLGLMEISSVAGSVDEAEIGEFESDVSALSAYNPFASAVAVTRCEGVTSALIAPGGSVICGQAGLVALDGWSTAEAKQASPLGLVVSLPSLPERFPDEMEEDKKRERIDEHREQLARIEAFFRQARHYATARASTRGAGASDIEYDRRLEAMIPYMRAELPVLMRASQYKQLREAIRFAERYSLRPVLLGARESWKLADELAKKKIAVILGRATDYPVGEYEPWDSVYRCASVLDRAGVKFCISVDDPTLGKLLGLEAGYAVAHGLALSGAMRAVTLSPAEILGVEKLVGSIEPGKRADLMVCTDSPLEACNRVVGLFIGGRPIELESRHGRLDAEFLARPSPQLGPAPELRGPKPLRMSAN